MATDFVYAAYLLYYKNQSSSSVLYSYNSFLQVKGIHVIRVDELNNRGLEFVSIQGPFYFLVSVGNTTTVLSRFNLSSKFYDSGSLVMIMQ